MGIDVCGEFRRLEALFQAGSATWPNLQSLLETWPESSTHPEFPAEFRPQRFAPTILADDGVTLCVPVGLPIGGYRDDFPDWRFRAGRAGAMFLRYDDSGIWENPTEVHDERAAHACGKRFVFLTCHAGELLSQLHGLGILPEDILSWSGPVLPPGERLHIRWMLAVHELIPPDDIRRVEAAECHRIRDSFYASARACGIVSQRFRHRMADISSHAAELLRWLDARLVDGRLPKALLPEFTKRANELWQARYAGAIGPSIEEGYSVFRGALKWDESGMLLLTAQTQPGGFPTFPVAIEVTYDPPTVAMVRKGLELMAAGGADISIENLNTPTPGGAQNLSGTQPQDAEQKHAPTVLTLDDTEPATDRAAYSVDCRCVNWYGTVHTFTPTQAACVKVLIDHYKKGIPEVGEDGILESSWVDSSQKRLASVFDNGKHPAWGTVIVPGSKKGMFRLATRRQEN